MSRLPVEHMTNIARHAPRHWICEASCIRYNDANNQPLLQPLPIT